MPLLLGVAMMFLQPAVVMLGWNWHVSPALDVPRIGYSTAWAIYVLVGLLANQHIPRDEKQSIQFYHWETSQTIAALVIVLILQALK